MDLFLHFTVPRRNFVNQNDLLRQSSAFMKNLGSKVKDQGHHKQLLIKMQFWSHNSIQICQVGTFVKGKDLLGQC